MALTFKMEKMNTYYTFSCKFCGKEFNKKQALAGHQTFCKLNPDYNKTIVKVKKSLNKIQEKNNPKIDYEIICPKCGKIHIEHITKNNFEKGKYKKYCSSFCAHSASGIKTKEIKIKISDKLKTKEKIIKICKICNKPFQSSPSSWNRLFCDDCKNEIKNNKSQFFSKDDGKLYCKICGQEKTLNSCLPICNRKKLIERFLKIYFHFDLSVLGNFEKLNEELNRIKSLLYDDYFNKKLSLSDICKKYGFKGFGNICLTFQILNLKLRNFSESCHNAYLSGKMNKIEAKTKYKSGYHITWDGKKVFLRSSYELDYAKELDKMQIEYEVENLNIQYFDSIKNKMRVAIPDFYLPKTNEIIEIKSSWTYNETNMKDKFIEYKRQGFNPKLILNHKEIKNIF